MSDDLKLIICRGLPASGKTTRARRWVAADPIHRARVNRDDLRRQLHDGKFLGPDTEGQVVAVRDAMIRRLLDRGISVVSDDTNLPRRVARDLSRLARHAGAQVEVWDLTDVPLDVCIARDRLRESPVGDDPIADMWKRYLNGRAPLGDELDEPDDDEEPDGLYVPDETLPLAILVDIDGTVALKGTRNPYDETRIHEDRPNRAVIDAVRAFSTAGYQIVFCSGRTAGCRAATEEWICLHIGLCDRWDINLIMRPVGDTRRDSIVKRELFDRHVRDRWHVAAVLDDRNQVVDMWRSLGLACFQVAPGDF